MSRRFLAAAVQMASGPNVDGNLLEARRLIARAAEGGARLVVLPENFALMGMAETDKVARRERPGDGPIQAFLAEEARRHGIHLVGGTVPLESADPGRIRAACLVYGPDGALLARYDKIHLFDVDVPGSDERYQESETIEAGTAPVVAETALGRIGLAVCYDLRFPELFRTLLARGAELFVLPAAFTAVTGRAHWEVLVRARAIENLCHVVAAAQGGYHVSGRETHGDSMVVDPWGTVLDRLPRGSGVVIGEVDLDRQEALRRRFPVVAHRRLAAC
ncbi:carbon-nitrogen hydrolase family protein [Inmirania thermothiophila]|uniref:Nitrilase n=1 Tax=Inmirania thermothiophila TaxID=1750597 RepID=A0A3N1Y7U2_9GAMM|nr:carbon-nitrogen hydrolase family protein [Inmirania thermothiophila]ROR34873.1 nitrilase [Inmirania thermothiophila]